MQLIVQLILIYLCLLLFKVKRDTKLAILLLVAICFNSVTIPYIPFGTGKYIICTCFILSELPHIISHFKSIKHTILKSLLFSIIAATIILAINSPHYNNLMQYIRLFMMELITKYFVIAYAFLSLTNENSLQKVIKISSYGLIILTGFAILNYITKQSIFINEILSGINVTDVMENAGNKYTYEDRFRVQAMFASPFDYGYICIILFLLNWYGYSKSLINKRQFYINIVCCIFGIITCGCRTNILCAIIGALTYTLFAFKTSKKLKYIVIGLLLGAIGISTSPLLQSKITEMLTIFDTNNTNISGSSIELRLAQYAAVLFHIKNHELFGRGLDYFNIDMGWGEGREFLVDEDLAGLEGVLMNHLLERGIIGVIFYLLFYISLLVFAYRKRSLDKTTTALTIAVLIVYLTFSNMTGELSSVFPTLLIIGCCLKLIYRKSYLKQNHEIQCHNTSLQS